MGFNARYLIAVAVVGVLASAVFFYKTSSTAVAPAKAVLETAEFGGVSLSLEFATSAEARERGLGGRRSLQNGYGMLFVFPTPDRYGFWMKDTLIPLDIFWLDSKGQVVYVAADVATSTYPSVFYPPAPARYVLETAAGFARTHGIATGTPLHLQNFPTVSE